MDPKEPINNAPSPVIQSKFLKWLDNLWYHYKWHILVTLFFLFTVAVCVTQCAKRENYDARFVFAGGKAFATTEREELETGMAQWVPKDYDGNGKKNAQMISFPIYADGTVLPGNTEAGKDFGSFLNTGECSVWLVSRYVYENFRLAERAVPLSETVGDRISGIDGYAVALEETAFYKQEPEKWKAVFPQEELYLLLGKPTILGRTADERQYEKDRALYLAVLGA